MPQAKRAPSKNPEASDIPRVAEPLESRSYFSPIVFSKPVFYPTGNYPDAVVAADLTGNGKQDIVTADFGAASIGVLMGNGDGTLDAPVFYPVGDSPQAIATADLNNDGIPDIVTANSAANTISVLFGNGDGTFQPQVQYPAQVRPESIAVADLTGNGLQDIIAANEGSNTVSIFMNNGDGTFAPAVNYFAGLEPDGLAVGDLNGDERPDIVTVNPVYDNLHVLLNQGDGSFKLSGTYDTGMTSRSVAIGDLNADGRPDLITSNIEGTSISFLQGIGNGTFQAHQDFSSGAFPFDVVIADINGDGSNDVVTANNYDNSISAFFRNGQGTFYPVLGFKAGQSPTALAVADMNGDGRPDIISVDFNTSDVAIDLNQTKFPTLIPTTATVTPQLNPVEDGKAILLTAQVTPSLHGKVGTAGIVQFFSGDAVLAVSHVNSSGVAHAEVTFTAADSDLTVHYTGDSVYAGSTSPMVVEQAIGAASASPFVSSAITATHFPSVFVPGDSASVTLALTDTLAGVARGTVDVQLYASLDGLLDSTAIPVSSQSEIALNLAGGQTIAKNVTLTFPADGFTPGTYTILAVLTPVQGLSATQVDTSPVAAETTATTALEFGAVGSHANYVLTRTENGSVVTFRLSGRGTGAVTENSDGSITLNLTGTNTASNLTISSPGAVTLRNIASTGELGTITASTTTLAGTTSAVATTGPILSIRALTLAGASDASIRLGGARPPRLSLGVVNGLTLYSYLPFPALAVTSWSNTSVDQITAPWIANFTSTGDFGASLDLSGIGAPGRQTIESAVIGGTLGDAVWSLGAGVGGSIIGRLRVAGVAAGWSGSVDGTVHQFNDTGDFDGNFAALNFGSILIDGNLDTADILAGATFGADGRLGNNDDMFGSGSITKLNIGGSVTNSVIAAGLAPLGDVLLGPGTSLQNGAISAITIGSTVDATTRIVAKTLPGKATIAGVAVTTADDPRFKPD